MRQERATELLRRHAQPRWDDLRAARVQKRVLEQLEIEPTSATPVRRWWWLLAAATVTAVILVIALGSWTRKRPNETRFADGSTIRAHDPARIVSRMVTGSRIEVEHQAGHATYEVTPRPNRQFTVLVGGWEVVVLGTVFEVGKLEDGVHVRVLKGRVEVSRADERFVLTAGEEVTFRNGAEQKHAAIQDDPEPDIPRDQEPAPTGSIAGAVVDPPTVEVPAPQPGPAELFRQADDARAAGDPARALQLLAQLVREHPGDGRVSLARFTMGRLHTKTGNLEAAAVSFESCGPTLGGEALAEAALARSTLGQPEQARALAQRYLDRFPQGPRASQMMSLGE